MLTLTHDAAAAIRGIIDANDLPDESGLRIALEEVEQDQAAVSLAFVAEPEAGDEVVDTEEAQVFLDPQAADLLDDKVLDAAIVEDRIAFSIVDREPDAPTFSPNGNGPSA